VAFFVFILVAVAYLKMAPTVGYKGLDTKQVDAFLKLKYWNFNQ
jgi:hypothetical protein